ncbi:hypothetical protein F0562_016665 [Nyssa sinensis]|uniref:Uncharacterized protein n=1 Tax=Nyssa sinensis TaxID=561372 RepID=A0A5J4ZFD6_9ASTE|nr:hypothetical protein F0562_016665 [Nyssa sinensis]
MVSKEGDFTSVGKDVTVLETSYVPESESGSGGGGGDILGGNGKFLGGGGGGGSGGCDNEGDDEEEDEFGPIMKFEEVIKETQARGASLPSDMLEAARSLGIRKVILLRYLDLQGSVWPLGFAMKSCSMLRNRMLADPSFLFKIGTEIVIDSCCATFAEVQKRGKDFWAEFELYTADLLVGVVVNIALVGMLAPYARIGKLSVSKGFLGRMQHAYAALPSSVFEAERPGCGFTVKQRIATYFYKEHKEIRRGHTCSSSCEECSSLGCFPCSLFQYPLSDHKWIGALGGSISFGKTGSSCCYGFYSWCAICQQHLWWDAVCGLGQVERRAIILVKHSLLAFIYLIFLGAGGVFFRIFGELYSNH